MKKLILASAFCAVAALAPGAATAADLDEDDYVAYETVVEEPVVVVRERVIVRRYVAPRRHVVVDDDYDDDDVVVYRKPRRHYYVAGEPYYGRRYYAPRVVHRHARFRDPYYGYVGHRARYHRHWDD